jgi:hypothetical protein
VKRFLIPIYVRVRWFTGDDTINDEWFTYYDHDAVHCVPGCIQVFVPFTCQPTYILGAFVPDRPHTVQLIHQLPHVKDITKQISGRPNQANAQHCRVSANVEHVREADSRFRIWCVSESTPLATWYDHRFIPNDLHPCIAAEVYSSGMHKFQFRSLAQPMYILCLCRIDLHRKANSPTTTAKTSSLN